MAHFIDSKDQNGIRWAINEKILIRFNLCKAIDPYLHDTWDINYQNFEFKWSETFSFKTQEEAQAVYDLLRGKKEPEDTVAPPNNIAKEVHKILELGWTNTMKLSPEDTKQFTEFWKKVDIQISNIMQVIKKEEAQAQALYDLLRGKNEESNLPKGSSGQILDGIGKWRDPTPEEIKEQEKILASNLDDDDYAAYDLLRGKKAYENTVTLNNDISMCNQCQELIKNVSYCVSCFSKRYSPLEEEVKVTAKEFYKSATYRDVNGVRVDIADEMNLRDKLDRISFFLKKFSDRPEDYIISKDLIDDINDILHEGEE